MIENEKRRPENPPPRKLSTSHGQIPGRVVSHLSAEERQVLARAEIVCQKQRIAMLRAECHEAVSRIRSARRILGERCK